MDYLSSTSPGARCDHVLVLVDGVLVLMGGYSDNLVFDDTWYFNITTSRWLQKRTFTHARFPPSCTDDLSLIGDPGSNCTALMWALPLERYSMAPFDVKPWGDQAYYYPDPSGVPYWGILDQGSPLPPPSFPKSLVSPGTPLFPYAGSGPRQYARQFVYRYNGTHNATLVESCMSVKGEPTRGRAKDDGMPYDVLVPQPRRQAPGWDGCRDRADGRADLDQELLWFHPTGRSQHQVVYSPDYRLIVLYGGLGYVRDEASTKAVTHETHALGDMWVYNINRCPANCSHHGSCYFGFCFCDPGYYGVDCSNISCPGDYCYYNQVTLEQVGR